MASGFCARFLFLSLLAFGKPARVLRYRSGDSSHLNPYAKLNEDLPNGNNPASVSSSYEGSTQPEGSSGPSYYSGSTANLQRAAAASWPGVYRSSYGGQVARTFPERSGSSSRKIQLQQRFQTGPNVNGAPPKFLSAQKRRYALGIVSSPAIEMHIGQSDSKTQPQQPSHLVSPAQQSRPIFHPDQLQQFWPQQLGHPMQSMPQPQPQPQPQHLHLSHPVFRPIRPQQLIHDMTQHKADLWRFRAPPNEYRFGSSVPSSSKHEQDFGSQSEAETQQPSYLTLVQPTQSIPQMGWVEEGRARSFGKVLVYGPGW
ncbi:hypothetical protein Q8A73_000133 [Channa argus]|nr:hypothetical protein Q8A73_000133 [Channa argus]